MDKVYRLLDWLTIDQAIDWLQDLTMTQVSAWNLLQLCESGQCAAYLKGSGLGGFSADYAFTVVSGSGAQKVMNPKELLRCGEYVESTLELFGPALVQKIPDDLPDGAEPTARMELEWCARDNMLQHSALFKSTDIQALADKMNGTPEQQRTDKIESLQRQLEMECAAREAAETEAKECQAATADLAMQLTRADAAYEHLRGEFRAMRDGWTAAQKELTSATAIIEQLNAQLAAEHAKPLKALPPETTTSGPAFPYSTKELDAMRAAVSEHWEGYTSDKRQPTQKAVALTLGELLGLPRQGNGDPARKAIALASAIKPDTLPDA